MATKSRVEREVIKEKKVNRKKNIIKVIMRMKTGVDVRNLEQMTLKRSWKRQDTQNKRLLK